MYAENKSGKGGVGKEIMEKETYYIYHGYRSTYTKSANGQGIAISKLTDPVFP